MKKNNSITFWLALIIVGWSLSINAQSYSGGGGTQASPYEIANKTDLRYLSEHGSERDSHGKTQVAILTLHKADYCDGSNDTAQRSNKSLLPYADAGSDATIFENQTHQLSGNASNHNSVYWTGGSGSFSDPDINNPVYTPQAGVYGNVSLTFHAVALYPDIEPASDEVIITIQQNIVSNAIVYVNKNVTGGNNDGSSWADAFTYFQDALTLAYANSDVSQIWVAAGVYYPDEGASQTDNNHSATFSLVEGVKLYGGFNGTETELSQRNIATNPTILSGDIDGNDINTDGNYIAETTADIVGNNSYHVLTADGTGTTNITTATQLNGFIISAGNAYGDEYTDKIGGGLLCNGSDADKIASPSIIQCSFIANSAEYYGGAIYNNGYGGTSSPIISHCCFSANSAGDQGGAICNDGEIFGISSPLFTNCSFSANSAIAGGAIFNDGFIEGISSPVFTNCSFSANSAENNGGAIYSWGSYGISSPVFTNCSFSANSAGNNGGAISNRGEEGTTSPLFTNCILWRNTATSSGSEVYNDEATSNFSFCNIAGSGGSGSGWDSSLGTDDANNMDSNPMFVDVANGDLRIYGMSPCADAGNNAANTEITDIRGGDFGRKLDKNNHTLAGTIDMGAYEYKEGTDPLSPCANPNDGGTIAASQTICSGSVPDSLTSLTLPSGHTGTLEYKWQLSTISDTTDFENIANSNAAGYQAGTLIQTTWLKRLARVDCMADWSGASESNVVEVTVIPKDDATFSYAAFAFCVSAADPTPTITGLPGGTFSGTPAGLSINASTGTIDVSVSTPGMYTVTYTTAGTCPNSSNVSVNIVTFDDAWFSYAANPFCLSTSDPTPNQIASPGGIFSSSPAGLVINASTGTIDVSASTPGVYDITYTTSGACSNSFTQTMVFVGGPTSDAGQNATICEQQTTYGLDATVFNASYVEWTSSGSGAFSDANFVDAIYTPSSDDVSAGSIELSLTAFPTSPCVAQAISTMTITFENTPVSGILAKSPDQFSACDGDDVSATLTPGSGGNGVDSLAYRTHDGSNWSAWINYNSGNDISTLGKTQIEILTLRKANYCNDASAEIVSWTVEETPVSGILDKTPDLANVCEGSNVSATLTPGSGGNGIDSLAYRTHDGSNWSTWIGYNSGDAISTLGKTQMEILTLRKAEYCNDASAEIVSWAVEETPVSGTLNKTPDLANVCEGSDVSATITPGNGGNGIDSLAYRTHDGSNWSAWIGYNSGDAISTLGKTQVEILTLRKADYCNDASAEIVSWAVEETPVSGTLNKTPDLADVCEGSNVSATLTPGSGGNGIDSLAYRTHDGSNWSTWIGYNSGDAISTLGKTQMEILTLRKANYCNDASAEIVSWSVEETPVSGTLNKTPDLADVCEGSDVSATITPGSGGNGLDSLAYRAHDGSNWSVWIGYNSDDDISTLGKTQVEILTLRKANYCNDASAEIVSWSVEETPVSGTLNKTPDLANVCEGSDVSATITPGSGGNGIDSLAYRTHDGSNWSAWIGYNSGDAISTLGKTQIEILTLRKANYCNDASAEIVSWAIHPRPVAVAGIDASIAQSETCTLSDATAENYSSVVWSTSGDGTFNSEASLNPVYTPGNNDIAAGGAHLCLTAIAQSPCVVDSTDCMMLTIYRNPLVEITTPADSSTVYNYALTVLGTASDADGDLTEVYVRLNGEGWQLATGTENWSIDLLLTGGYQKIEAMAIDAQNLESDLDEINIFVGIQEIDIYQGWSAISSYLIPLDPALEQVMQNVTIPGNLTFMLGQSGMLWPEFDINTIGNWDVYQGYKVKHKQADVLTIFGDKPDDNSMTYPAGLYMIPVLSNTPALISAAFSDPENDVDYIFDVTFGGIYWPQGGIVSLSELIPGMGYIAKFNKAVTLTFPDIKNLKSSATPMVAKNETSSPWAFSRTAEVHLVSIFDDALNDLGNVSHIGAFDNQGNCIGAANITQKGSNILLVIYGDDGCTGIKDGDEEGELITFRAYDATTGIATALQPVFSERFANHDGLFTSGGLSAVASFKVGAAGITGFDLPAQIRVYPNPAKDMLNLVFDDSNSLDGISFELINSNGSKVLAQNISERHTKLNISLLQPGVFILKISDKGNSFLRKVIIQ